MIDKLKKILQAWEDGSITRAEYEHYVQHLVLEELLTSLEKGDRIISVSSCCCRSHPPIRTFNIEVTVEPHGYSMRRI